MVNVVELHTSYLFSDFIGVALLCIIVKTKNNTIITTLQASSKIIAYIRLWSKARLVLNVIKMYTMIVCCLFYESVTVIRMLMLHLSN